MLTHAHTSRLNCLQLVKCMYIHVFSLLLIFEIFIDEINYVYYLPVWRLIKDISCIYTHDTDMYILVGGVDRCALVTHNNIVNLTVRFIILAF